jgi:hypothetical protein
MTWRGEVIFQLPFLHLSSKNAVSQRLNEESYLQKADTEMGLRIEWQCLGL